mgnify:CR=1 FL=1
MVWVPLIFSCVMYRRTVLSMEAQFKRASALSRLVSMEVATSRRLNSAACKELARTYWLERVNSAAPTASEVRMVKKAHPPHDLPPQRETVAALHNGASFLVTVCILSFIQY